MTQTAVYSVDVQKMQEKKAKREHAIQEMEKHLSVAKDGTIVLGAKSATDIQVDPDSFNELSSSLQAVNHLLKIGQLRPTDIRLKTEMQSPMMASETVTAAGTCNGVDYFGTYWWGMRLYVDECGTQDIINAIKLGASGAAALAAYLAWTGHPALILGLVSALLALSAGLLAWIDELGGYKGLEFSITWIFVASWFWHQ